MPCNYQFIIGSFFVQRMNWFRFWVMECGVSSVSCVLAVQMNFLKLRKKILKLLSSDFSILRRPYWQPFCNIVSVSLPIIYKVLRLQFHAEVECCSAISQNVVEEPPNVYRGFLQSRPGVMEVEAIRLVIDLCRRYRYQINSAHFKRKLRYYSNYTEFEVTQCICLVLKPFRLSPKLKRMESQSQWKLAHIT